MKSRRPSAAWCALTCTTLGAMGALYAAAVQAQPAQSWPAKPVTFLVAAVPGGSNEAEIRLYSQKMTENNPGKSFVVDFKPGAGGTIAANYVAKAAPDGSIMLVISP